MRKSRHDLLTSPGNPLNRHYRSILSDAEAALYRGLVCKRWLREKQASDSYTQKFPLVRTFNHPVTAFGFLDNINVDGTETPIMGSVSEETYDWVKPKGSTARCEEFREFVLRYFLRISDFRLPEAFASQQRSSLPFMLEQLCWCMKPRNTRAGFGYSQLYYKTTAGHKAGVFPDHARFRIVDLRDIGPKFEWVVLKVCIFDFDLGVGPFGKSGPEVRIPLNEESLVIISPEFVYDNTSCEPGIAGEFGFGYAVLQPSSRSLVAYGPGQFELGFSQFVFRILDTGEITIRRTFVVNRPSRILNIPLNPLRFAEMAANLLAPTQSARSCFLGPDFNIDPVFGFVALANALTLGFAGRVCCVSREQLERQMLVRHFMQDYQMIVGSLNTWRQIPDWKETASLPQWIVSGVSS